MGNEFKPLIEKYINNAFKIEQLILVGKEEKKIMEICSKICYNNEEIIFKDNLKYCIQLLNPDIFEIIFSIFGRKKEKHEFITFDDMKYLYFSFKTNEPKVKAILISFLLFENKNDLSYIEINKKFFTTFNRDLKIQQKLIETYREFEIINSEKNNQNVKKKKRIIIIV